MRKKSRAKAPKKRYGSKSWVISIIIGLFLIAVGIGLFFGNKSGSFCANSISCIKDLSGKFESGQTQGVFMGRSVNVPTALAEIIPSTRVLGDTTGDKQIDVDLTNQHLYAYQGGQLLYSFPVSTGKWHPTPTGTFHIWIKLKATRMTGGSGADYYDLPNVPYTMFFYNDEVSKSQGFSVHGAYWHNNFGHPMSHGCINMRPEDAAVLFAWADPPTTGFQTYATDQNPGTEVVIYGQAPTD